MLWRRRTGRLSALQQLAPWLHPWSCCAKRSHRGAGDTGEVPGVYGHGGDTEGTPWCSPSPGLCGHREAWGRGQPSVPSSPSAVVLLGSGRSVLF